MNTSTMIWWSAVWLAGAMYSSAAWATATPEVRVGSKKFTESVILGEIVSQLSRHSGTPALHRRELGGTRVLWNALLNGEIDLYPEYTGTLLNEVLVGEVGIDPRSLSEELALRGVRMSRPLGFENTYGIGMKRARARELGIESILNLHSHPRLKFGFSNEFMDRGDGWPGLRQHYDLPQTQVRGLDHDLAYRALASGKLDATDLYSTDAEIRYYDLIVLADDANYFPQYQAVLLYRAELKQRLPDFVQALQKLEGRIAQNTMVAMNARAKLARVPEAEVAADFLQETLNYEARARVADTLENFIKYTREHLALVALSLSAAIVVSIPLGVAAAKRRRLGQVILALAGTIQTIPALALLVFMIPLLGIGGPPAIVALFLYSLLPIIRNTSSGLKNIALEIRESAEALGLSTFARLRLVELPLAMPTILAGIKTSAVINIGTATLGALIGAGGYGQPILTGIRLDDMDLILQGAIPAAVLALIVQGLFEFSERYLVPKGLRL